MNIKRVYPSGYCKGVVNAIQLAKKTRQDNPDEKIYVLGMIVHNSFVTKELEELNIITLDDTNVSKEDLLKQIDEGIVIFTAHGISDQIKQQAKAKGLRYVDASCEDVLKTRNIIIEYLNNGYDIVYFGKKKHPEAEAIISISDRIHLVSSEEDIRNLSIENKNILLTNQTTMSYLELEKMFELIKDRFPTITIKEEICKATTSRQKAISELKDCDLLYVVGDVKSNNSNKLVEIGLKHGIKKALLIQSYLDINKEDLRDVENIYITAGASTPLKQINEVIDTLNRLSAESL